ncbi:MAG: hypothetical protein RL757_2209 [Bacteroidota bacterium]|jgi:NADH-quinone oxidoreductase subunit N
MKELLALVGTGVFTMIADMLNLRKYSFFIVVIGLATAISFSIVDWNKADGVYGMLAMNNFALGFNILMCATALLWFVMSDHYFDENNGATSDQYALIVFSLVGALCMVSYTNMSMLFLGIEILSIPMYIMAGSQKRDLSSNEASFKYFLMGAFASGFLLFGIALIYGVTGSFDLASIASRITQTLGDNRPMLLLGVLMLLIGLGFKVSAAPFHFWAPDVYQGAPIVVTAFMATIVKTAAFAAMFLLFNACFRPLMGDWSDVVATMIVLTLFIGNITAVLQTNVKRMLAYSSISHAGYMMIAMLSIESPNADSSIFTYSAIYSVATLLAFTVIYIVNEKRNSTDVAAFNGLGRTNPLLAFAMTLAMLSMAGIPPLAGFMAKYFIFVDAIQSGHIGLIVFAISMSLVSLYYYLKVIIAMYFAVPSAKEATPSSDLLQNTVLFIGVALLILFGLMPGLLYTAI